MFSKISINAIGKTQKEFQEAENHYLKQIKTKMAIKIISPLSHLSEQEQIIKESEALIASPGKGEFVVALDSRSSMLSSREFCDKLISWSDSKAIAFIIGGSYGLSPKVLDLCDFTLSFSKLTFPHQLARIILLEQIYRAEKIKVESSYHK